MSAKSLFQILSLNCFLSLGVQAHESHDLQDYIDSNDAEIVGKDVVENYSVPEEQKWLYELLISETDRTQNSKFAERSFSVHLADSYKKFPEPEKIVLANLKEPHFVSGKMVFAGIVAKQYKHEFSKLDASTLLITIKIHFKTKKEEDWEHFSVRLKTAEAIWETAFKNRWQSNDFNLNFSFQAERVAKSAHFSVNVLDETRGPYDTNWSRGWSANTVAHEIGHMLGLGDEYNLITSKSECLKNYIMCTSSGSIQKMHLYYFLRRLVKEN